MPGPKAHTKVTGDIHPPELEDEESPLARDLEDEARPGKGENQAGFLKENDRGDGGTPTTGRGGGG